MNYYELIKVTMKSKLTILFLYFYEILKYYNLSGYTLLIDFICAFVIFSQNNFHSLFSATSLL